MAGFQAIRYDIIAGPDEIAVTGTSMTLGALMAAVGTSINGNTKRITLLSSNLRLVSWANGVAAVDGTNQFPDLGGVEMDVGKIAADALRFISDGTSVMVSVVQEG